MAFMQKEITSKQTWLEIDGNMGSTFMPMDVLSREEFNLATETKYDLSDATLNETFGKYYDGKVTSLSLHTGYGARMSAPGYMDCTDWTVYATQEAAEAGLDADYGDDDSEDDDDSDPDATCSGYDGPARLDGICDDCGRMHSDHEEVQ